MSQAVHLVANNLPGFGPSENKCLPCSGLSGRVVTVSSCSSRGDPRICSQVKIGAVKCVSKRALFVCKASSGGHKRNSDFLKQNKNGFRGRNRQNEERDSFDDESELFPSKNGPLLSHLSNSPKFQATAAPGPREKEIVELFRKVQAQLRERAATKEDKKTEVLQGQHKESETVDSLLKLLRKHSVEQGKRKSSSISSKYFNLDPKEQNVSYDEDKSSNFFDSSSKARPKAREPNASSKDFNLDLTEQSVSNDEDKSSNFFNSSSKARPEAQEPNASSLTRPVSNFRRKSPVTQFKYQAVYSSEDKVNSASTVNSSGKKNKNSVEINTIPEDDPVTEPEPEPEPEASLADGIVYDEESDSETNILEGNVYDEVSNGESNILGDTVYDEVSEDESSDIDDADNDEDTDKQEQMEHEALSALKLPELRALAKSRGVKGYSKMKKAELVDLLGGSSV